MARERTSLKLIVPTKKVNEFAERLRTDALTPHSPMIHVLIRSLTPEDAEELALLLVANRELHEPFSPARRDSFFTVETQRKRLAMSKHLYGILDNDALAGMIELSNVARGPFQSANLGFWVDEARRGRGLARGE